MNVKRMLSYALCVALVAAVSAGCKTKKKPIVTDTSRTTTQERTTGGEGQPAIDQEKLLFGESGLQKVYFDFDSSALRPDALATLATNADMIKQIPGFIIQIAGHCDERGTQEYNLALGERRADAVRNHLIQLGVSGDRLVTISFGEEMPAMQGHDEGAWGKNRRCEFNKAKAQ